MTASRRAAKAAYMRRYRQTPKNRAYRAAYEWTKARVYQRGLRRERKRKLVELKGGKCVDCGFAGHIVAFQFDHLDPTTKVSEVTTLIRISWEKALAEAAKCDLVCANCHAIRTFSRRPG